MMLVLRLKLKMCNYLPIACWLKAVIDQYAQNDSIQYLNTNILILQLASISDLCHLVSM